MNKWFRKFAAILLASALLLQNGTMILADEGQSETQTEAVTEKPTEAPTEAVTEKPTEAPTEAVTEKPTEAPTEAVTEKPTEAPTEAVTEKPTEAPTEAVTEKPTEAPTEAVTEKPTEAPTEAVTEKPTEVPAGTEKPAETEKQTEEKTEKETEAPAKKSEKKKESSEKETEEQTERSERENDGKKMTMESLTDKLQHALPWLFVAESVNAPSELLEGQEVSDGSEGGAVLDALKDFSLKLANAKPSSQVQVFNLYADENGMLDTAQLDDAYKNHVIDVTKQYCVVNVIADSADQALSFSGYEMTLSGKNVEYKDGTEPGDIIYNFAAMDDKGEKFVDYEGELSLGSSSRLQGTFLAPAAKVTVRAELAGAVYAKNITVADFVTKVMQISFAVGREPVEEESDTSAETEESESDTSAAETEESESDTSAETEGSESDVSAAETEESESDTSTAETEETEPDTTSAAPMTIELDGVQLDVRLVDAVSGAPLAGNVYVMELEGMPEGNIAEIAAQGQLVIGENAPALIDEAEAEPVAEVATVSEVAPVGSELEHSGNYYLTAETLAENYETSPRRYFSVSQDGEVLFDGEGWDSEKGQLTMLMELEGDGNDGEPEPIETGTGELTVNIEKVLFNDVELKAVSEAKSDLTKDAASNLTGVLPYISLYKKKTTEPGVPDAEEYEKVAGIPVASMSFGKDSGSASVSFTELAAGTYRVTLTDADGDEITGDALPKLVNNASGGDLMAEIAAETTTPLQLALTLDYGTDTVAETTPETGSPVPSAPAVPGVFPAGFYYPVTINLTKELLDSKGTLKNSSEIFYGCVYTDPDHTKPAELVPTTSAGATSSAVPADPAADVMKPVAFNMGGNSSATVSSTLKATASPMTFYVAETDSAGAVIAEGTGTLRYDIGYEEVVQWESGSTAEGSTPTGKTVPGAVTVKCQKDETVATTITNQLRPAVVKLAVKNEKHHFLSDVTLVIKAKGKNGKMEIVQALDDKSFLSGSDYIVLDGVLPDGEYYLSEVSLQKDAKQHEKLGNYAPAEDIPFTVTEGTETVVDLINAETQTTNYSLKVEKQVYSGRYQVYARADTTGIYAKEQTFHVALFKDIEHTVKVSDVQEIRMAGLQGSTTFTNLKHSENGQTRNYFVAETDEYGEVLSSSSSRTIKYANDGMVPMDAQTKTAVVQNVYTQLPRGYRYTATLTISKRVLNAAGTALPVNETFYVGIFRKADYSDTPTIVTLALNNRSSISVRRRILLDNSVTYYLAEVDANGNRIDNSTFAYDSSIDQPVLTISRGEDKAVTVTNQERSTKVTLYLTTRVYNGTMLYPVNETFYAGLFRDPQFTKLYTQPIPMTLQNKSELTLKLSLNLGTADKATIYIAEVDKNGNVIRNEQQFGYQIRVVNSTAVFTRETREIQTIFLNSVYGSSTSDDWQQILSDENNRPSYGGGGGGWSGGWVGGNGEIDPTADTSSAQTGDETPIGLYVGLLAAAAVILILLVILRLRKKKRK